jgi:Flp pilus assembly protein TadG
VTRRDERGSAALEAAIGVPAFALFVGLVIFGGRTATTHQALQSAAADAARSNNRAFPAR